MSSRERRRHRRVPIALKASCRKVDPPAAESSHGLAVNASPGGLYVKTMAQTMKAGDLLEIELSVPPTTGVLESGGEISGRARVVRTDAVGDGLPGRNRGLAVELCHPLRLQM